MNIAAIEIAARTRDEIAIHSQSESHAELLAASQVPPVSAVTAQPDQELNMNVDVETGTPKISVGVIPLTPASSRSTVPGDRMSVDNGDPYPEYKRPAILMRPILKGRSRNGLSSKPKSKPQAVEPPPSVAGTRRSGRLNTEGA